LDEKNIVAGPNAKYGSKLVLTMCFYLGWSMQGCELDEYGRIHCKKMFHDV
jgi:hypothetical protein